jgi:hypothetical protein
MAKAKLTQAQKFDRAGVIAFDVDGVLARTTATGKLTPEQIVRSVDIAGMGAIVASFIRDRVRDQRQTAQGPFAGYGNRWNVTAARAYTDELRGDKRWWRTKSAQADDVGSGLFSMTGKMWAGLQARSSRGGKAVVIDFREMSAGAVGIKAGKRVIKKGKRAGQEVNQRASTRVKNSDKAYVIHEKLGINVTQPTFNENMAMADAVSNKIGLQMAAAMDADSVQTRATSGARTTLVRSLKRYWEV